MMRKVTQLNVKSDDDTIDFVKNLLNELCGKVSVNAELDLLGDELKRGCKLDEKSGKYLEKVGAESAKNTS